MISSKIRQFETSCHYLKNQQTFIFQHGKHQLSFQQPDNTKYEIKQHLICFPDFATKSFPSIYKVSILVVNFGRL